MPVSCVLPLAGSCNLRDFGGHATIDGRVVRRGRLYRSGVLARLDAEAVRALLALDLRAVCDLRRSDERERHPSPDFGANVRMFQWRTTLETSPIRDRQFVESATLEDAHAAMRVMYQRLPFALQPRLAGVFDAIEHAGEGAMLVHCSAGKDRTGVAVALVLAALGVPRETIVEDYVLTNEANLADEFLGARATGLGFGTTADAIQALPPMARAAVLDAHPSYLGAALDAIEARHGGVERYLVDELRLDPVRLSMLRARLLE
jgi:protein-tyrosine phosphatase